MTGMNIKLKLKMRRQDRELGHALIQRRRLLRQHSAIRELLSARESRDLVREQGAQASPFFQHRAARAISNARFNLRAACAPRYPEQTS